ncbi:MAG: CusA/CzcA family heavy metal efflux RND transporter [Bacteroidota bacterium]|jgi:Cu(I)/Ag(I) efflux system membrane protein CusA/SilA|nr:CusA/CzcA family heavy metal efflux RND transporter [Bacteroidota bacterium]
MIERIIEFSARNRFLVLLAYVLIVVAGIWAVQTTPVDAIPDLSENQVIVFTEWMGRSPRIVEDQVTFPLVTALQGVPDVEAIRAQSMFGMSFIYIIFDEHADLYWARSRVLEKLATVQSSLPAGADVQLGPDGTGVGHVFWYTVEGKTDLAELRAVQDWYLKLNLQAVDGVAEVASIGGFVRQYQIDLDPRKLQAYDVTVRQVRTAVMRSNNDVGGKLIEVAGAEAFVRGQAYLTSVADIEDILVANGENGTPVRVRDVGVVQLGGDIRRGSLEKDGRGQTVGGVVVMRQNENAMAVIERVKEKLEELTPGLPRGVKIHTAYDRTDLITAAIDSLRMTLLKESIVVSLFVLFFLLHVRSVLRVVIELPIAVLIAFIFMKLTGMSSNIMSLGGIAIAIGVIVDASIVLVENAHRNTARAIDEQGTLEKEDYIRISVASAKQVGPAIFYSVAIMVVSFLPVFLLEGQEGKLFHPLAYTKTFVMIGSAIIAITLVPVLMTMLNRGKFRREDHNPITRVLNRLYSPVIRAALRWRKTAMGLNVVALLVAVPMILTTGSEFMPSLDEGSLLFMPVTLPSASITEVNRIMQVQDAIIRSVPEVETVLGKAGRAETPTDPAPVSMIESIILLKPRDQWRPGMTQNDIISELDAKLQIPGVRNGWTQPIINRINMLATGVRTDLGVKIFGSNLDTLEMLAIQAERLLRDIDGAADLYAERTQGGLFLDIAVDREALARYGVTPGDVQDVIEIAIGGENIGVVFEGRQRFPLRVRFDRERRDDIDALRGLPVPVNVIPPSAYDFAVAPPPAEGDAGMAGMAGMGGSAASSAASPPADAQASTFTGARASLSRRAWVPLGDLARIDYVPGPPMIASENAQLRSIVFLNVRGRDMGGFVADAKEMLDANLQLPQGYSLQWSGQYENQIRARERLSVLLPIVVLIIVVMLYMVTKDAKESLVVMLSVPFALIGGVYLIYFLGYNFSVAVWVGFIALFGLAVETGIVMVVYLHEALDRRLLEHARGTRGPITAADIHEAAFEGSVLRLRPKIMTVGTTLVALLPIMWSTGVGTDVMRPLAAPMIGGLITSAVHVLIITPVLFTWMKERALRTGTLEVSRMAGWMKEGD